jgi:uncharacterized caspase-like protein
MVEAMAHQWALLIGINQYAALQPLMYAQADAVSLRNFFVDEVGVPIDHCVLLTDMSAAIEPYAHFPTRQEIQTQLQQLCQHKVAPGDLLWVFFSGYGLTHDGQDYLVPVDGDPTQLAERAIALSWVYETLKSAQTDQLLVVLDMNRSEGAIGHQNIGQQTLELAKDFGISTLLSCQPVQYSHETLAVRHGLFTQALLEGMRYHGCITISQLAAYGSDRVPELSQHHWRPVQNPVAVIPAAQKFMMVVPAAAVANLPLTESAVASTLAPESAESAPETAPPATPAQPFPPAPSAPPPGAIVHQSTPADPAAGGSALWNWGIAGGAIALLLGVFFRYQPTFRSGTVPAVPPAAETAPAPAAPAPVESPTAESPTATNAASDPAAAPTEEATTPLFSEGTAALDAAQGESALQRAQAALDGGRYGEARAWLDQVPAEQQGSVYLTLREASESGTALASERNQEILREARRQIQPISASQFNNAIETARQIPPADPYYEQAQADIDRWSRIILDLAEGRAAAGDLNGAIAAAQLVPADRPAIYQLAQERIAQWQRRSANRQLLQEAQNSLQPGQASSFQNGIRMLKQITPDQPEYAAAQDRIAQWSEDILVIARARAAQGRLNEAIAAARLVPSDTSIHPQAQAEIQRWQSQI